MPRTLVLIPSSRYVDKEMQLEVGQIPPVLIPINGKPLLDAIIERYSKLPGQTDFVVVACEGKELFADYLKRRGKREGLQILEVPLAEDLGQTIVNATSRLTLTKYDQLLINFGDTLIDADVPERDAIFYGDLRESYRWTTFAQAAGRITGIVDKYNGENVDGNHVFCGAFLMRQPAVFVSCLEQASGDAKIGRFYAGLQHYLKEVEYDLVKVKEWLDFGHVDNYYQAKKRHVNKRFFNQIEIDEQRAIVKKKSQNVEKFSGEIKWYLELPASLKCYIPQVFGYSLARKDTFIRMEYYGYPTLGELYLFAGHSLGVWHHVFDAIFGLVREFKTYQLHEGQAKIDLTLRNMYLDKTLERLKELEAQPFFGRLYDRVLAINGKEYPPLRRYIEALPGLIEETLLGNLQYLSIIHGDLCLPNILFDPKSRVLKLIDPRGSFGEYTIYGDYRYELAKLSHSFNGHYESIVSDTFFLVCQDDRIDYSLSLSPYQSRVSEMFNRRLQQEYPSEARAVALIEALLFISMVPLHKDFPNRQLMMLATGIQKLDALVRPAAEARPMGA